MEDLSICLYPSICIVSIVYMVTNHLMGSLKSYLVHTPVPRQGFLPRRGESHFVSISHILVQSCIGRSISLLIGSNDLNFYLKALQSTRSDL